MSAKPMTLRDHADVEHEPELVLIDPIQKIIETCPAAFATRSAEDVRRLMRLAYLDGQREGLQEAMAVLTRGTR